ncbi:MAG TPA: transporter substrate-binding domain-containing protein [Candidatus Thermoplasmatota archaeon]|nr:transporter substrate-binding domain-containing protein [Candidatus Thermoplasmatota archaeon]
MGAHLRSRPWRAPLAAGLVALLLAATVTLSPAGADDLDGGFPELTQDERNTLQSRGTLRVTSDGTFAPFAIEGPGGRVDGINPDFVRLLSVHLGIETVYVPSANLTEALERLENGEVDVVGNLVRTPEREVFLDFTEPYAWVDLALWTREGAAPTEPTLEGVRVAVTARSAGAATLQQQFPEALPVVVEGVPQAIEAVELGHAVAALVPSPAVAYYIQSEGIGRSLHVHGEPVSTAEVRWAVRDGETELAAILQKGMDSISTETRRALFVKWTGQDLGPPPAPPEPPGFNRALLNVLLGTLLVLAVVAAWGVTLRRQVRARTSTLATEVAARKLEEQRLRAILDLLPVGVFIADASGRMVETNAAVRHIWGEGRPLAADIEGYREYKGWWAHDGKPIAAHEWALARALTRGETSLDEEIVIEGFDGVKRTLLNSAVPLRDERGVVAGAVVVNVDITERKRAEAARAETREQAEEIRRLQELNEFKTQFMNTAAHELNTPLTPLKLQLHLMKGRDHPGWSEADRRSLDIVDRGVDRIARLVQDLLDASRLQGRRLGMKREPMRVAATAQEVVEAMKPAAARAGVTLEYESLDDPLVEADGRRIHQVLLNLVANALKFTPPGGHVRLVTKRSRGALVVTVADTGRGLTPDQIGRLFQPFSQVHADMDTRTGTGLGLFISKGIIDLHLGRIWCESGGEGKGATFTFTLPVLEPA